MPKSKMSKKESTICNIDQILEIPSMCAFYTPMVVVKMGMALENAWDKKKDKRWFQLVNLRFTVSDDDFKKVKMDDYVGFLRLCLKVAYEDFGHSIMKLEYSDDVKHMRICLTNDKELLDIMEKIQASK